MDQNEQILTGRFKKKARHLNFWINIFIVLALMMGVATLGSFIIYYKYPCWVPQIFPHPAGDYAIGLSVTLASLSGVLLVYLAFLGQRLQMIYQQQDLRDNREEMKNSTAQLKIQAEALTSQISRMDRDFIHQNFFRILDLHFSIRDNVSLIYEYRDQDNRKTEFEGKSENAFELYFRKLLIWVDDTKSGWPKNKTIEDKDAFLFENGFSWVPRRTNIGRLADGQKQRFLPQRDKGNDAINKKELAFIIRAVLSEKAFGAYLRSCYYLFGYMKQHNLEQYLDAVDAGMRQHERVFLFYQIHTQFEESGKSDLRDWLKTQNFLRFIHRKHLLDETHIIMF